MYKQISGRLLALAVGLHSHMISLHVRQYRAKLAKAVRLTDQANTDMQLARSRWEDALDSEMSVAAEVSAAESAAAAELNSLPNVTGYGRVRTPPPFGATPQVIDKRN